MSKFAILVWLFNWRRLVFLLSSELDLFNCKSIHANEIWITCGIFYQKQEFYVENGAGGTYAFQPLECLELDTVYLSSDIHSVACIIFEMETKSPLVTSRMAVDHDKPLYIQALKSGRIKEKWDGQKIEAVMQGKNYLREPIFDRAKRSKFFPWIRNMISGSPQLRPTASRILEDPKFQNVVAAMSYSGM